MYKNFKLFICVFMESDKEYRGIFQSYNFSTVFYFSRVLDGASHQITDFINDEDLGNLFVRIHDEPLSGYKRADISGGNEIEFEKVADAEHAVGFWLYILGWS